VKKAPAKQATKAATKKTPAATRAPAKKTGTTKSTAAKAPAKKAPTKKAPTTKAATTKAPALKTAAQKTTAKKAPAKSAGATSRPAKKVATNKSAPAKKAAPATPVTKTATTTTKKAAAKAPSKRTAAPSSFPVLPGEKPWTKAEVDEVLSDLHDDRARVVRTLTAQEAELAGLMRDAGDGAGHDQADMGATSFERDQELTVVNNEREKLAQIDRALARIADGTYGICESCGNPIGKGRAMAFPRATLCLTCKQREERR
jgi:RNA polymerase-binding protein DksA